MLKRKRFGRIGVDSSVLAAVGLTGVFVYLAVRWSFVLTAPSDPIQYVAPSLNPSAGFGFIDRITLWLWIRPFGLLPIDRQLIGPISTLALTSLTVLISSWYLIRKVNIAAGVIFAFVYTLSPISFPIATYTYSMQILALVLVSTLVLEDEVQERFSPIIRGLGVGLAPLSKIQGLMFGGYTIVSQWGSTRSWRRYSSMVIGAVVGFSIPFLIIASVDGSWQVTRLFETYFGSGVGEAQMKGRQIGGFPPFYRYLAEPSALFAICGFLLPWLMPAARKFRKFAALGLLQSIGLLGIYLVTRRGGPLIYPYSYDSFVLGTIAASAGIGYLLDQLNIGIKKLLSVSTIVLLTAIGVTEFFGAITISGKFSAVVQGSSYKAVAALFAISGVILIVYIARSQRSVRIWVAAIALFAIVCGVGMRAQVSLEDSLNKRIQSGRYHEVAKEISRFEPNNISVGISLNGESISGTSFRLGSIYDAFYKNLTNRSEQEISPIQEQIDLSKRFILTNDFRMILKKQYSSKSGLTNNLVIGSSVLATAVDDGVLIPLQIDDLVGDASIRLNKILEGEDSVIQLGSLNGRKFEARISARHSELVLQPGLIWFGVSDGTWSSLSRLRLQMSYLLQGSLKSEVWSLDSGDGPRIISTVAPFDSTDVRWSLEVESLEGWSTVVLPTIRVANAVNLFGHTPYAVIDQQTNLVTFYDADR